MLLFKKSVKLENEAQLLFYKRPVISNL